MIDHDTFMRQVVILGAYTCDDEELTAQACNLVGLTVRELQAPPHGTAELRRKRRVVVALMLKLGLGFRHVAYLTDFCDSRIHHVRLMMRSEGAPI